MKCVYCGSMGPLTIDHVVPKSRWRELQMQPRTVDNPSNRVLACRPCNAAKSNLLPAEWFARHPEYVNHFRAHAKYLSDQVKRICGFE